MRVASWSWVLVLALGGCSVGGPLVREVLRSDQAQHVATGAQDQIVVIDIDRPTAALLSSGLTPGPDVAFFADIDPGTAVIGTGDVLEISILTTNETGFVDFANSSIAPIATSRLPLQDVGVDGMVHVPPIGRVLARGSTVARFETFLTRRLSEVMVDASAIVRIADRRSARVAVLGRVVAPGSVAINETDATLVDMIAAVGGPTHRADETTLSLSRSGSTRRVALSEVYAHPHLNIHAMPGDVLSLQGPERRITFLGATERNASLTFDEPDLTLAVALASAGGLATRRADRTGVFIYRDTPRETLMGLPVDLSEHPGALVPTILRFDLSDPATLFATQHFAMADGDIVYVADSLNEQIDAVVSAISPFIPTPDEYVRNSDFGP